MFRASYMEKHGLSEWSGYAYLNNLEDDPANPSEGFDSLYIHEDNTNSCYGFWLATSNEESYTIYSVYYEGYTQAVYFDEPCTGVRPIVILDSDIPASEDNGIWQID